MPDASADSESDAQQWYRKGIEAYKARDLAEAERCFRRAFELEPSHVIAGNLGQTLFDQGAMREAAEVLRFALSVFPATVRAEIRQRAEQLQAEAAGHVVELTIRCNVPGAEVRVAGKLVGRSPLELPVYAEPGEVRVEATVEGYQPAATQLQGAAGARLEVALELEPVAVAVSPVPAASAAEEGSSMDVPVIAVGVASLVTAAVGAVLLGVSVGHGTDAEEGLTELRAQSGEQYPCAGAGAPAGCADIVSSLESHDALANASTGVFIGAGALLVTAAVLFAVGRSQSDGAAADPAATEATAAGTEADLSIRWQAGPWLEPGGMGLVAGGRFY